MHSLEPYFNWRNLYTSEDDPKSPFYGEEYSEFYFTNKIYDHLIHPQWDNMGSSTLFIKIIYVDYDDGFAFIELMGEWNDTLHNDIMYLKRDIADRLKDENIDKFILIGENVLNFHPSDDCYYEEWFEELEDGWIALLNFRDHVLEELTAANIDSYFVLGGAINEMDWRTYQPIHLFQKIEGYVNKRLGI
ncbi:MAG: hypothetical protein JKY54_00410 [Flavobacteriales bacterium]|nr:hypothetical protein [Flavobacteriales bacterium]